MTGDEHRAAAERAEHKAAVEQSKYDPDAHTHVVAPRAPIADLGVDVMHEYNPTASHLEEADRQMQIAYKHMQFAERLERTEEAACAQVPATERTSCPVLAPHIARVQEVAQGVTLYVKSNASSERLANQLRCHLAYAKANDFNKVPCPLFIKGVTINLREGQLIDVFSADKAVAAQVRQQARRMFGEAIDPAVSSK